MNVIWKEENETTTKNAENYLLGTLGQSVNKVLEEQQENTAFII